MSTLQYKRDRRAINIGDTASAFADLELLA
jgi:hypothetical protein